VQTELDALDDEVEVETFIVRVQNRNGDYRVRGVKDIKIEYSVLTLTNWRGDAIAVFNTWDSVVRIQEKQS
jgi:hypothetical protein